MVKAGITGGIGSGKTTVCSVWERLGAYILNADDLAKRLMAADPRIRKELVETFGEKSFNEDGTLNRRHLSREAFRKGRVEELNRIVHPRLPSAVRKEMARAESEGYPLFVYEAALLLENLQPGQLDYIVLVIAGEEARIERVQNRDNIPAGKVRARIRRQRNFEEAVQQADFVIRNNGTLQELEKKAEELYKNFLHSE